MNKTNIEYLTHTSNPIVMRCRKCSPGCIHCWHLNLCDQRAKNPRVPEWKREIYAGRAPLALDENRLKDFFYKKPSVIGVQFMGDLFNHQVNFPMVKKIIKLMVMNPQHKYILLTKNSHRMAEFFLRVWRPAYGPAPRNLYCGVSVCVQHEVNKLNVVLRSGLPNVWVSVEPMLSNIIFTREQLQQIVGVVCGGESNGRPCHPSWVRILRNQMQRAGKPFMFKQWGSWVPVAKFHERDTSLVEAEYEGNRLITEEGAFWDISAQGQPPRQAYIVKRIGKKKAGRLLDGFEHMEVCWK